MGGRPEVVTTELVRAFAALFAPIRSPHAEEGAGGEWVTRRGALTDGAIAEHLRGERTFGVKPSKDGTAYFVALEVDFGPKGGDALAARNAALGDPGWRVWQAIRDAGEALGVPAAHFIASYSGGRSLHLWCPIEPSPQRQAHAIAKAIVHLAELAGVHVCTSYPTGPTGSGMALRLPWGRHRRTGVNAHFVDLAVCELRERPALSPLEAAHLQALPARLPRELVRDAAAIAKELAPRPSAPQATGALPVDPARPQGHDPLRDRLRPCVVRLVRSGVEEHHRHDVALLVRTELKRCGFSEQEALPVAQAYGQACRPPWVKGPNEKGAEEDLHDNWEVTDPSMPHVCPGRGAPGATVRYVHEVACVGKEVCLRDRIGAFVDLWGTYLAPAAVALYVAVVKAEVGFCVQPGGELHTSLGALGELCNQGEWAVSKARDVLVKAGLLTTKVEGKGRAQGCHTVVRRTYPLPLPPRPSALPAQVEAAPEQA